VDLFLITLISLPLLFAVLIPLFPEKQTHRLGIFSSFVLFLFSLTPLFSGGQIPSVQIPWFPELGIQFALGSDGISYTLVVLTTFLTVMAAIASLSSIHQRLKLYYSMVFVLIAAVLGVFLARDFFLFFLFWELELIPMFLLIAIWGGPRRQYASMKFVLYTLFGSAFLVAALLGLYFLGKNGGAPTQSLFLFETVQQLVQSGLPLATQVLLFTGMFITFAVKLPMVPFHTWLPDAHVEAPTPISMLLAGILLKMGAYGMLKICFGIFPDAAQVAAPYMALLALINIVYTGGVALVQQDLKKLIAYSSVSHMGFVLLGLASLNAIGYNGAMFVMISHGLVSAALFMCVGTLYNRTHSRQIADYGGFAAQTPTLFYFFLFMSMASLGLPLLVSFASESLVFYGAFLSKAFTSIPLGFTVLPWSMQTITVLSAIGIVIGAAYLLWMLQRVFFGPIADRWKTLNDATPSETLVLGTLAVFVLLFGVVPQLLVSQFETEVTALAQPATLASGAPR
jgi:NADH-quinone oxidoreductase subunit M